MPAICEYPGVYVEEDASPSLSVAAGATAVPVFPVARSHDKDNHIAGESPDSETNITSGVPQVFFLKTTRINSWLEFTKALTYFNTTTKTEVPVLDMGNALHRAVKSYFLNGGSYCYLVPTRQADYMEGGANESFQSRVEVLDDVTLLVEAGVGLPWENGPTAMAAFPEKDREQFMTAVASLCKSGNSLFALLDGPQDPEANGEIFPNPSHYPVGNDCVAVYYPYLQAEWTKKNPGDELLDIPPSAAVAGAYCRNDRERGVWKAPANITLAGGLWPKFKSSDDFNGKFNLKGLNFIRELRDRGTLIWGARTLTDAADTAWRYVPVRRLFNSAEKDIKRTMQTMVFEPNNQATWEKTRGAIDNYLRSLWKQGALLGESEAEAYFVQVGKDLTMTQTEINDGKMIVKVGMAAVRPAEFIILQFTQNVAQG